MGQIIVFECIICHLGDLFPLQLAFRHIPCADIFIDRQELCNFCLFTAICSIKQL